MLISQRGDLKGIRDKRDGTFRFTDIIRVCTIPKNHQHFTCCNLPFKQALKIHRNG